MLYGHILCTFTVPLRIIFTNDFETHNKQLQTILPDAACFLPIVEPTGYVLLDFMYFLANANCVLSSEPKNHVMLDFRFGIGKCKHISQFIVLLY